MAKEQIGTQNATEVGKQAALAYSAPRGPGWAAGVAVATELMKMVDEVGTPEEKAALLNGLAKTLKEQEDFRKKV